MRSGTENVPGMVGFGIAAKIAATDLGKKIERMSALKERLKNGILNSIDNVRINTPDNNAPHILNVSFGGTKAEVVLHSLEMQVYLYPAEAQLQQSKKRTKLCVN